MGMQIVPKEEFLSFIGHKFEAGEWFELSQQRINEFADCTEDHQFIHIDQEKAAQTPFGGTIAHGFLTLSALVPGPGSRRQAGSCPHGDRRYHGQGRQPLFDQAKRVS